MRFDIEKLKKDPQQVKVSQNRVSGLNLVKANEYKRLYILGKPGAGKTTFLKYIALQASLGKIRKIPIFISLKEWADSNLELMEFLVKQFDICTFPDSQPLIEYILETGQAIILFDGLDETQHEGGKRDQIIDSLRDFSRKYDETQILITCRIAATDYSFDRFAYLEVADFTDEQVYSFITNWFDEEGSSLFYEEFNKIENENLREMATTPLLLSLLCLNFEETFSFPQRRVEIYEDALSALLHRWDASMRIKRDEIYKGLSAGRKKQMFARIAAQTFEKNDYFVRQSNLEKYIIDYLYQLPDPKSIEDIDGEAVLKAIEAQHSIIIERAKNIYSFSHLTFQEYFTAKYIVDNAEKGTLKQLLKSENIADDRWREVTLITASLLDDATSFFQIFQNKNNSFIVTDAKLKEIFLWANEKAKLVKTDQDLVVIRIFYIYLALAQDFLSYSYFYKSLNHFSISNFKTLDIYSSFNLISNFIQARSLVKVDERAIGRNYALEEFYDYKVEDDLSLDFGIIFLTLHSKGNIKVDFQEHNYITEEIGHTFYLEKGDNKGYLYLDFDSVIPILKKVLNCWSESKINDGKYSVELENFILEMRVANKTNKNGKVWEQFLNWLKKLEHERNLDRNWEVTWDSNKKLEIYLKMTRLLLNCLELATVSDRKEVKNRIFETV